MQVILAQFIKKINVQISKRLLSIVASRGEKQVNCSIMEPLNQRGYLECKHFGDENSINLLSGTSFA